jgi:hypothetical protein
LYPICDSSSSFHNTAGWRNTSSRNQMRRWPPRVGIAWGNHGMSPIVELLKGTSTASRSRTASCSVVWGFGFRRTGPRARPRPGALGGALVMPRKIWSGPVLPPPKLTLGNRGQIKRRVHARTHAHTHARTHARTCAPPPSPPPLPPPSPPSFSPLNTSPTAFSSDNRFFLPLFSSWRDTSVTAWQHAIQRRQAGRSGRYTYTARYPKPKDRKVRDDKERRKDLTKTTLATITPEK